MIQMIQEPDDQCSQINVFGATPRERLARLLAWLAPAWTPAQRRQTVEAVLGSTADLPTNGA